MTGTRPTQEPHARDRWVARARALVEPALSFQAPTRSEIRMPGARSWHGDRADGMEALARVFLLDALAGCADAEIGRTTAALLDGIAAGVGAGEERWPTAAENSHVLVEAPSVCLGLWVGGHRLWRALPAETHDRLTTWLTGAVDLDLRANNWMLFPWAIGRFLASVGRPHPRQDAVENHVRARLDELYLGGGWYTDGGSSTFDYYNSFAFHFYPGVVGTLSDDADLRDLARRRLAEYLPDLRRLVADDGAPVAFGRSLTYRFGIAAPLSVGALLDLPDPAGLRVTTERVVEHFARIGGVRDGQPLSPGWGRDDPEVVQDYSGPGAAYWSAHTFTNLLLDPDHSYWGGGHDVVEAPGVARLTTPNFLVATAHRQIIRLTNHGSYDTNVTDVKRRADDPFYGRLGYSNVTLPLVGEDAAATFTVQCAGRRYRRSRISAEGGGDRWAASVGSLRDLRSGRDRSAPAGFLSIATPDWDVHVIVLPRWATVRRASVTFHGWPVDGEVEVTEASHGMTITGSLTASLQPLAGFGSPRLRTGRRAAGPYRLAEVTGRRPDGFHAVAVGLAQGAVPSSPLPSLARASRDRWVLRVAGEPDRVVHRRGASLQLSALDGSAGA